ncbi:MAG: heme biosynthesis HemY N-terminal domain-containing protein [Acetobacteraceae bacterium]
MRRIILILLASAIVLALAWFLAGLPGHVVAEIGTVTVETTTPVAALGLLLFFVVGYIVLRLLGALVRLPETTGRWRQARHQRYGDEAVTRALVALAAGDRADARRESARARRHLGDTPQTLLLAAEAGRMAGRDDEAEAAFKLLADRKDAAFLGYRGLLRQAITRENWSEAAILARRAEAVHPGASWVREERAQLAIRAGHWSEALDLADPKKPRAALAAAAAEAEEDPGHAIRLARRAWKEDPGLPQAALAYADRLRAVGQEKRAQAVIARTWTRTPQPDLAAFALAPVSDKTARHQAALRLTAENRDDPESRLLLARTALEAGLTDDARQQVEAAQAAGLNQRRLWLLVADIEAEARGDTEEGRMAQREALRRTATAEPDPTWRCTACQTQHPVWLAACPVCSATGTIQWGTPPAAITIPPPPPSQATLSEPEAAAPVSPGVPSQPVTESPSPETAVARTGAPVPRSEAA